MPVFNLDNNPNNFTAPGGQADTILGNGGNDTLNGADQNDSILGGADNDRLDGGSQNDTVRGEDGNDTIVNGSGGNDLLDGGTGTDSIVGSSSAETILGGDANDTLFSGGGADLIQGGDGNDSIIGGTFGAESLFGGAGDDVLIGSGGPDALFGGSGNDTFSGYSNDSQNHFIAGDGGSEVTIINATYNAASLNTTTPGTINVGGVNYAYQASYVTDTGYRLYFGGYTGVLQFNGGVTIPLNVICFAAGTMIMTSDGERVIETLRAGDMVVTASGHGAPLKPVRWVGHREIDLDAHPRAEDVAPILVMPGAFGAGVPHRPLRVSPDHALLVEGALIPAKLLVDGEMVRRLPARGRVTYFHVELDMHDILLAEGAPSESYIDLGNRDAFDNAGVLQMLHADFTPRHAGGMPKVTDGPALDKARLAIARRRGDLRKAG